ncbi:MAG TPA: acyl carrier protein [Telmatospirillum sp.]|nr:acyl carrier protein [Telmatospirillum sp.]
MVGHRILRAPGAQSLAAVYGVVKIAEELGLSALHEGGALGMQRDISDVKNWMNLFRWIVKLIRDEYGVPEEKLTRAASIELDIGLSVEQVEEVLVILSESFHVSFPAGTLDELVKFEELCMLTAWLAGLYKQPEFLGAGFAATAAAMNPSAGA